MWTRNDVKREVGVWLAGFVAGAACLYLGGPAMGYALRDVGGHLIGMSGDAPLDSADEVRAVVEALAPEAVRAEATRVVGPARVVRR